MMRIATLLVLVWLVLPASAFTSLYVFGDSASAITNSTGGSLYYGKRYCNGRVWVEVLAQRQGLLFETNKTWSHFGHYSVNLVTNVGVFPPPADAGAALFVVWVNNADFVDFVSKLANNDGGITAWTNAMNQSLTNHQSAIQTLYTKGVRTLLMPNVVDLTLTPFANALPLTNRIFIRQRTLAYNDAFTNLLNQMQATLPGLIIRSPDFFTLLDNVVSNAPAYGLTNAVYGGIAIDALTDPSFANKALNGPGTNHIFWDYLNPGAKAMAVMADVAHQSLTPTRVAGVTKLPGTNRLDAVNLPVGLGGVVEATTNFNTWSPVQSFASTNATQGILVEQNGPRQFYRLRFPFAWAWP
jgi:phospholipase/lecithinase/hemolysin